MMCLRKWKGWCARSKVSRCHSQGLGASTLLADSGFLASLAMTRRLLPTKPWELGNLGSFCFQFSVGSTALFGAGNALACFAGAAGTGGMGGVADALRISIPSCSLLMTMCD